MTDGAILAIDQGTTNTKAIVVSRDGEIIARASTPMKVYYPQPGWAEQSATEIWNSVRSVIAEATAALSAPIDALAISNQRESIVIWDANDGVPIAPAVIWQCRRSTDRCTSLRAAGHNDAVVDRTGLAIDPLFPATKIAWILDSIPGARARANRGDLRAGTIDSWLLWNLSGGAVHATDHSNASRTQLFNTRTLQWDEELARIFDVPLAMMPEVMPSDSHFGQLADNATSLPEGTPIRAMIGDSHAALFGHGIRMPGMVKATYGTGSSLMTLTAKRAQSNHGLSGTIAWSTRNGVTYALEGNISVSGQAAAFMAEMLGLGDAETLTRLAGTVDDTNGVVFVPALVGLGAPHWRPEARGEITGMSLGTRPAHLARAALEAIAFQISDVFEAMETDLGTQLNALSVDGGASRNDFLMQFQADLLDRPVLRGNTPELSAMGACMMAATSLGHRQPEIVAAHAEFLPLIAESHRAELRNGWKSALAKCMR